MIPSLTQANLIDISHTFLDKKVEIYFNKFVQYSKKKEENNDCFAGTGSLLNSKQEIEMDAMIMDGKTLRAGSVACVQNIAHPVALARLIMDKVFKNVY